MGRLAVVGGADGSGVTLRVYDDDGTEQWTANHGATLRAVAIDSQGNVIVGGEEGTGSYTVRKYDPEGTVLWSYDHGEPVYCVAVDASDHVLMGGYYGNVRRLSSDGATSLWTEDHGATVYGIAAYSDGGVVLTGKSGYGSKTTRRYSSAGSLSWSYAHGATTYAICTNNQGIFTAGEKYGGATNRYLTSSGTLGGTYALGENTYCVSSADANNPNSAYLLCGGYPDSSNRSLSRYFYSGASTSWYANHGATVYGIAPDNDGNVFIAGAAGTDGYTLRKYNSAGTLDTGWNKTHDAALAGVAWSAWTPETITTPPGLPLQVALGLPGPFAWTGAPPLGMAWALAAPTSVGALPPDGRLTPLPVLYRGFLSGTTDVEFPVISLQCTRRRGQSTWLVVEVMYTPERAAAIAARAGGQLIIYAGLRTALGQELLGEFARAWLTETEATQEPGAGRLILTGRLVPTPFTAQTRTLLKVTQRQVVDGRHEVRCCAVDPLLRPNDTVVDGAESWVAGTIHYRISAREAFMQVTEVSA